VINEGRKYNMETPIYMKTYAELKKKNGTQQLEFRWVRSTNNEITFIELL
jgi:hypothetical protein